MEEKDDNNINYKGMYTLKIMGVRQSAWYELQFQSVRSFERPQKQYICAKKGLRRGWGTTQQPKLEWPSSKFKFHSSPKSFLSVWQHDALKYDLFFKGWSNTLRCFLLQKPTGLSSTCVGVLRLVCDFSFFFLPHFDQIYCSMRIWR